MKKIYKNEILWVIGDSIFDFENNGYDNYLTEFFEKLGFKKIYKNNISGSTIAKLSNVGIIDHFDNNLYETFETPNVIIIQRGTNDVYHLSVKNLIAGNISEINKNTLYGSINYIIAKFKEKYPKTTMIWSSSLYRNDLNNLYVEEFNKFLKLICDRQKIYFLDLYKLSQINLYNHHKYLYDGLHPNDCGYEKIMNVFSNYLITIRQKENE